MRTQKECLVYICCYDLWERRKQRGRRSRRKLGKSPQSGNHIRKAYPFWNLARLAKGLLYSVNEPMKNVYYPNSVQQWLQSWLSQEVEGFFSIPLSFLPIFPNETTISKLQLLKSLMPAKTKWRKRAIHTNYNIWRILKLQENVKPHLPSTPNCTD